MSNFSELDKLHPHANECPDCVFLGPHEGWDLYFCDQGGDAHSESPPVVIATNPNEREIPSTATKKRHCQSDPILTEALERAKKLYGWDKLSD